jgi:ionotropic glutamate receptor
MPRKGLAKTLNSIENTPNTYSTSKSSLAPVIWAGDSTSIPKGWEIPINGKKLRIGVPSSSNFGQFVKETTDRNSNMTTVTGYSIAIFEAAVDALPYAITYEYIPFVKPDGKAAGTYNDLVYQVYLKVKPLSCFYIMLHHISTIPIGNALL